MAKIVHAVTFANRVKNGEVVSGPAGLLSVLENYVTGFDIKRVYWLHGFVENEVRAGHYHKITKHALFCPAGSCDVTIDNGEDQRDFTYHLAGPDNILVLEPRDWHVMKNFSSDCTLMVLASENYLASDYVYEPYPVQN